MFLKDLRGPDSESIVEWISYDDQKTMDGQFIELVSIPQTQRTRIPGSGHLVGPELKNMRSSYVHQAWGGPTLSFDGSSCAFGSESYDHS